MFRTKTVLLAALLVVIGAIQVVAQQGEIAWNRARQLRQRSLRGEKLTEEEQTYLQRAIELRQKQRPQRQRPQQRPAAEIKPPVGLKPLTDMTADDRYKGQDGGLYGGGRNEPPKELDVSRFSRWKRPGVTLPWNKGVFLADIETYWERGIRHITTFAAWIDAKYRERFGALTFIDEYGVGLSALCSN